MDIFVNKVEKLLYFPKLSLLTNKIQLSYLPFEFVAKIMHILLKNYSHTIYYNPKFIHKQHNLIYPFPILINNQIENLNYESLNLQNSLNPLNSYDIIIIPFAKNFTDINHISCFYINIKSKNVLYFDPLGIDKELYHIIKPIMKKFLIKNNIISDEFKFITFNFPIQKYIVDINDPNNYWYEYMTCGIIISIFSYMYSTYGLTQLIKLCKIIKQNINKFKQLLLYSYIAVKND